MKKNEGGYGRFKRDGIKECSWEQLKEKRIELFERLMHSCLLHTAQGIIEFIQSKQCLDPRK
jgi:hypothetical protein